MRMRESAEHHSIVGSFKDISRVEQAINDLKDRGFRGDDITVSMRNEREAERMADSLDVIDAKAAPRWLEDNVLVGVECAGRCDLARGILASAGADDIRWARIHTMEREVTRQPETTMRPREARGAEQVMQVREESLEARTRRHKEGEVDIAKRVVEEERTMRVPVTHEEVRIERHAVQGPSDEAPQEGTISIPVYEEEIVLEKRPRLVEEIRVSKRPVTEEREVKGTIRREVPEIKRRGDLETEDVHEERR